MLTRALKGLWKKINRKILRSKESTMKTLFTMLLASLSLTSIINLIILVILPNSSNEINYWVWITIFINAVAIGLVHKYSDNKNTLSFIRKKVLFVAQAVSVVLIVK